MIITSRPLVHGIRLKIYILGRRNMIFPAISGIHTALAASLPIIDHVTNCCKRLILVMLFIKTTFSSVDETQNVSIVMKA